MEGVLNERTDTVHRHERGGHALHTECGVAYHLDAGQLRRVSVERASADLDADRCGRCFDDGGGY